MQYGDKFTQENLIRNSSFNTNLDNSNNHNLHKENSIPMGNKKNEKINQINVNLSSISSYFSPDSKNSISKDTLNSNSTIGNNASMNSNKNKKKTFIKINENNSNKGVYAKKSYKPNVNNISSASSTISNNTIKKGNKISYINTNNSNSAADTKINSNSNNSNNVTPQSEQFSARGQNSSIPSGLSMANNYKDLEKKKITGGNNNQNNLLNIFEDEINNITNNMPKNFLENLDSLLDEKNPEEKDVKNYNNLIHYLEKYRDLNDKLIENLESEKNSDKKIDLDKRKKDVEYLEHVLEYITSLGDNKENKDLIPFYLIDKRKLFENMVKYLYSKDEMIHSTKPKNVRLYKYHNKPK